MPMFTRTKPAKLTTDTTTAEGMVPPELAEAYAAATPDIHAYTERAASQLAGEALRRQKPESHGAIIVMPADRQRFYTDHLPEVLARAEHLSRLDIARMSAFMADKKAERLREIAEHHTCPLCQTVSRGRIQAYRFPAYLDLPGDPTGPRMCPACAHTADLLHSQETATPERQAAVRSALAAATQRD